MLVTIQSVTSSSFFMAVFIEELAGLMAHHHLNVGQNRGLLIYGNSNAFLGVSYAQVALAQGCSSTEGLGSAAPHHLPFGDDVMTISNAAQGGDMLINEKN